MYARSLSDPQDDRPDETFEDRRVTVETTFDGAGVISGDMIPECAAVVTAVLESLSAPMGAEDTRTREQRYHDALAEAACDGWSRSDLLPERAGQPVKAMVHVSLAELRAMDDDRSWKTVGAARCSPVGCAPCSGVRGRQRRGCVAGRRRLPGPPPATRPRRRWSPATWTPPPWMTW